MGIPVNEDYFILIICSRTFIPVLIILSIAFIMYTHPKPSHTTYQIPINRCLNQA